MIRTTGIINNPIGGIKDVNMYAVNRQSLQLMDPAVNQSSAYQKTLLSYDPKLPIVKRMVDRRITQKQIYGKREKYTRKITKGLGHVQNITTSGIGPSTEEVLGLIGNYIKSQPEVKEPTVKDEPSGEPNGEPTVKDEPDSLDKGQRQSIGQLMYEVYAKTKKTLFEKLSVVNTTPAPGPTVTTTDSLGPTDKQPDVYDPMTHGKPQYGDSKKTGNDTGSSSTAKPGVYDPMVNGSATYDFKPMKWKKNSVQSRISKVDQKDTVTDASQKAINQALATDNHIQEKFKRLQEWVKKYGDLKAQNEELFSKLIATKENTSTLIDDNNVYKEANSNLYTTLNRERQNSLGVVKTAHQIAKEAKEETAKIQDQYSNLSNQYQKVLSEGQRQYQTLNQAVEQLILIANSLEREVPPGFIKLHYGTDASKLAREIHEHGLGNFLNSAWEYDRNMKFSSGYFDQPQNKDELSNSLKRVLYNDNRRISIEEEKDMDANKQELDANEQGMLVDENIQESRPSNTKSKIEKKPRKQSIPEPIKTRPSRKAKKPAIIDELPSPDEDRPGQTSFSRPQSKGKKKQ